VTPTFPPIDTDGDGILDGFEGGRIPPLTKTNRFLMDSDGDGLSDGIEDANHDGIYDPLTELNPRSLDTDGDGLQDGIEALVMFTNPMDPLSPPVIPPDTDGDGLPDPYDSNLTSVDSDGDRFGDAYEAVTLGLEAVDDSDIFPDLGDVDRNGVWDNGDTQLIINFIRGGPTPGFDSSYSDLNRDGNIDETDARLSLDFYGRRVSLLPADQR